MAARGLRDMGDGKERVANPDDVAELKARAWRLNLLTLSSALTATALLIVASR